MSLAPGTRLGGYELVSLIGAGGMGEVYRARDLRLARDVAVKALPGNVAADPDRLQRFAQEARATAALNHPNILAVYDIGAENGLQYVVSELLEGETLKSALQRGALPPRKAVEYGAHIARGLAAAHDRHIVHRDLKPDNIFITREGRAKILDFGLARVLHVAETVDQTMTAEATAGTAPGMVLGTIGYMSPEQVRGLTADHRSDIFSFGAVLYEMLSGTRAFRGATAADTMSAILSADPPELESGTGTIPPILDRLVRRCLEKAPDERYQSARDLAFSLEALSTASAGEASTVGLPSVPVDVAPPTRGPVSGWTRTALVLLAGLVAGGAAVRWTSAPEESAGDTAYRQLTFRRGEIRSAHFGPDGQGIVYAADWEGHPTSLFTGRVDAIGERSLSIDGQVEDISINGEVALLTNLQRTGHVTRGTLSRMPLAGGAPRAVVEDVGSASWGPDGKQLAIVRAKAQGGWQLEFPLGTVLYETRNWIETPRVSSDGTRVAFLEHPPAIAGDNRGHVSVISSGQKTDLTGDYSMLIGLDWHPNGELWFSASDSGQVTQLLAVRPGQPVRRIIGLPAAVVIRDVRPDGGVLLETTTRKARALLRTVGEAGERDIGWLDYPLLRDISADGTFVLFDEQGEGGGAEYSVFVRPTDGGPAIKIGDGYSDSIAPDMKHVLTRRPGRRGFRVVPIGAGEPRELGPPADFLGRGPARWWPDGKNLVVMGQLAGGAPRTYLFDITTRELRPITPEGVTGTLVSPDKRTLVVTVEDERRLFTLGGNSTTPLKGLTPGDQPVRWSPDSRALFVSQVLSPYQRDLARLDVGTGRRTVIATFGPTDAAGVPAIAPPVVSADGRVFGYRYGLVLSDLFLATGLK